MQREVHSGIPSRNAEANVLRAEDKDLATLREAHCDSAWRVDGDRFRLAPRHERMSNTDYGRQQISRTKLRSERPDERASLRKRRSRRTGREEGEDVGAEPGGASRALVTVLRRRTGCVRLSHEMEGYHPVRAL